ncbi:uncharacterized protein LOC127865104 isoform X3 [Dreissena polymorpha]|nr:uncharacterized protein LOC127865104 isoform X3 [Dreissena polymorpha]
MEESSAAVQVYALESATACTQRVKDCNAELKTHHAQSDALEKSIKAQVDRVVNIMDSRSAALEKDTNTEKATVSTLIDRTTVFSRNMLEMVQDNKKQMSSCMTEITEDNPTGLTPVRSNYNYRRLQNAPVRDGNIGNGDSIEEYRIPEKKQSEYVKTGRLQRERSRCHRSTRTRRPDSLRLSQ